MALKFTVGEVPRTKPFQFADLAELTILVGLNSQVSKADLDGLITTGRVDSDPEGATESDLNEDPIASTSSRIRNAEDCFKQFGYRSGALDEHYPFSFGNSLLTAKSSITNAGYVYLFCLICSRLRSFSGKTGFAQHCAKVFTELSSVALKASLKNSADIYIFDAGSDDRANVFDTDLRPALRRLAAELNARPDEDLIAQQSSSGDGGLVF